MGGFFTLLPNFTGLNFHNSFSQDKIIPPLKYFQTFRFSEGEWKGKNPELM